ncbi:MAG: branched-chain amino acid transporter permease [bacterium]
MTLTAQQSFFLVLVVAGMTLLTRALPFILFYNEQKTPMFIFYLGRVLPHAVIAMLIVYCLKDISLLHMPFGIPEIVSVCLVAFLHFAWGNVLMSIAGGTLFYMFLVQVVFG